MFYSENMGLFDCISTIGMGILVMQILMGFDRLDNG
jgi:hypothetical protein